MNMAAVDVEVHTTIDRPRREVAAYCCDPGNVTAWNANIVAVQWDSPGSRPAHSSRFTSDFLGRRLEYTYEVAELVPEERLVMRSDRGTFLMETAYLWEDDEQGGTWMTLRNRGEPTAFPGSPHRSLPPPSGGRPRATWPSSRPSSKASTCDRSPLVRLPRELGIYRNPH